MNLEKIEWTKETCIGSANDIRWIKVTLSDGSEYIIEEDDQGRLSIDKANLNVKPDIRVRLGKAFFEFTIQ
jgi:hypothetical protein